MVSSVQVAVRVRPPFQTNQLVEDVCVSAVPQTRQIIVGNVACFTVDYAFPCDTSQSSLYDTCVADLINFFLQGNDIAIIIFGKCNSGKSYSLFGPLLTGTFNDSSHGIILRATQQIFNTLSKLGKQGIGVYKVYISFIEIFNGEIRDLLAASYPSGELPYEGNEKGWTGINGLENVLCHNFNKVFNCIKTAIESRVNSNQPCGRQPHSVFTFTLHHESVNLGRIERKEWKGVFTIVGDCDCGPGGRHGRVKMNTNNDCGVRLLSEIIATLSQNTERWQQDVVSSAQPFFTTMLKDGLSGRSQTLVLCCVSPATSDYCDTLTELSVVDKLRMLNKHQSTIDMQPTPDVFGLEFAVSQWERLVTDAEGLFHKLIENGLPKESKMQIEQWLCLKQECSDCLVNDDSTTFHEKITRSLERIDEVTEFEELTEDRSSSSESESAEEMDSQLESDSVAEDDGNTCLNSVSLVENKNQDFDEKLEIFMEKFKKLTSDMIDEELGPRNTQNEYDVPALTIRTALQNDVFHSERRKNSFLSELPSQTKMSPGYTNSEQSGIEESYRNVIHNSLFDKPNSNVNKSDDLKNLQNFQFYEKTIIEKYKAIALDYEKRLQDLELIKQIAGDSAKKVADMENNLQNSKKKMQKLVKLLKRTEEHKYSLEKTVIEDQKRINELEEKCKLQFNKSKVMETSSVIKEDKEHLKDEAQLSSEDNNRTNSDKDSLRQEIINLRRTREYLLDQRRSLDTKLNKDKVFTNEEERKFLELDEAIEAIDTVIEYKNEIICGHTTLFTENTENEKGEKLLMDRLMKLSEQEMRSLLYKYYRKVVDLRESGRRLEQQLADQDHQIEAQTWKIRALSNAVQQAHIENERRLVMIHREHDEKLHLMFRHYGGQIGVSTNAETSTGGSSVERDIDKVETIGNEPLIPLQGALPKTGSSKAITIPQQNLKKLQGSVSTHTTKVTRKKNKLIIHQHKAKQIP